MGDPPLLVGGEWSESDDDDEREEEREEDDDLELAGGGVGGRLGGRGAFAETMRSKLVSGASLGIHKPT